MKTFVTQTWLGPDRERVFCDSRRIQAEDIEDIRGRLDPKQMPGAKLVPVLLISRPVPDLAMPGNKQLKLDL